MNLRLALLELAAQHRLDAAATRELHRLAGFDEEPAAAATWLPRGVAVLAAALVGFGVILWIAANWDTLGRFGRFALLQAVVAVMCAGAMARPAARAPLGLLALLAIGGLFAYFGQTYQTGADPWQLFALWAMLALPLCLGVRSDVVWAPWALVVATAISLWIVAHTGHRWRVEPHDLRAHLLGWGMALTLAALLSPPLRRYTGAGAWALRTALTLVILMITTTALWGLFFHRDIAPHYGLGVLALAVLAGLAAWPSSFDLYGLSGAALGLNVLLVAGLGRWLFNDSRGGDFIGPLFLLGLAAAGLLAATVSLILRLARTHRGAAHG